jgi:hypothetical protein
MCLRSHGRRVALQQCAAIKHTRMPAEVACARRPLYLLVFVLLTTTLLLQGGRQWVQYTAAVMGGAPEGRQAQGQSYQAGAWQPLTRR